MEQPAPFIRAFIPPLTGIRGWAKNLADGRVEVVACGTEDDLDLFFRWLKQGPKNAKVVGIAREEVSWEAHENFIVL